MVGRRRRLTTNPLKVSLLGGNRAASAGDYQNMTCDQIREAISARLDGEEPGLPAVMLDAHLAGCAACSAWATAAAQLNRSTRLGPAPLIPDRTGPILAAAADRGMIGRESADAERRWRGVLAGLALLQIAVAVPGLLLGNDADAPTHVARELGSWDVALAVGFLFAAWRPSRAWGMLPLVAALVGCLLVTTGIDVSQGHATLAHEAAHVLEVAGLGVLWHLAHRPTLPRPSRLRVA